VSPLQTTSRVSLDLPEKPVFFPIDFSTSRVSPLPSCWKSDLFLKYFAAFDIRRDFLIEKPLLLEKYSEYGKIYIRKEDVLDSFAYGSEFSCVQYLKD